MRILVYKMVIDTSPLAYSFWSRDVVLLCHYSYEICKLEIGADPFDSGIGFLASEKREEIIGIGVRSNPFCTEEILIEFCDALGRSIELTIGEGGCGYTRCSALRFGFARWCRRSGWRIVLTEIDSKRIVTCRKIRGKEFAKFVCCRYYHNKIRY